MPLFLTRYHQFINFWKKKTGIVWENYLPQIGKPKMLLIRHILEVPKSLKDSAPAQGGVDKIGFSLIFVLPKLWRCLYSRRKC